MRELFYDGKGVISTATIPDDVFVIGEFLGGDRLKGLREVSFGVIGNGYDRKAHRNLSRARARARARARFFLIYPILGIETNTESAIFFTNHVF